MAVTINGTTGVITPDLTSTGTTVLAAGKVRSWSATDTDIDGLISGSAFGVLAEGGNSGHFTVGLRSNDVGDGFQVISKGAATTSATDPYTTLCFEVKANGNVGIGTGTAGVGHRLHISSPLTGTTPRSNSVLRIQSEATGRDVNIQLSDNITNSAELGMVGGAMYMATAGTERMRIDSSGRVTMPAQPAFLAQHNLATATTPSEIIWSQAVQFNIGSCYSSTTGRFTAPVAGTYFFRAHILPSNAPAGETRVALCKNGVAYGGATTILVKPVNTWATVIVTSHMYLAVGDYASVILVQLPASGALHSDVNFNSFSGHLVG